MHKKTFTSINDKFLTTVINSVMINGYNFFNVLDIEFKFAHMEKNDNLNILKVNKCIYIKN